MVTRIVSKLVIIWSVVTIGYLLTSKGSNLGYNIVTILVTNTILQIFPIFLVNSDHLDGYCSIFFMFLNSVLFLTCQK